MSILSARISNPRVKVKPRCQGKKILMFYYFNTFVKVVNGPCRADGTLWLVHYVVAELSRYRQGQFVLGTVDDFLGLFQRHHIVTVGVVDLRYDVAFGQYLVGVEQLIPCLRGYLLDKQLAAKDDAKIYTITKVVCLKIVQ